MASRRELIARVIQGLQRIVRAVHAFSRQSLRDHSLTGPQLWALRTMAAASGITVSELAHRMYLHISTVSSLLDRLAQRRLVTRSRDAVDGRVVRLRVTGRGRAVLRSAPQPPRSKLPAGLERLGRSELRRMSAALRRLAAIMELTDADATYFEDWTPEPRSPHRRPA